jgi:hypothetical protein
MEFSVARPDVIRAISQRWLLNFWCRHLGALRVPQWQAVEAEDLTRMADSLSFLDVARSRGDVRFMIRFHGATIGRVYGSGDCRGKFLDEIVQRDSCASGLAPYHRAAETGRPVYTIEDMSDRQSRLVHNERLLLPFSRDGVIVDRILAAFEFICPDGAFDSHELMKAQIVPPTLRLSATIEARAPG